MYGYRRKDLAVTRLSKGGVSRVRGAFSSLSSMGNQLNERTGPDFDS
jgi:hypothetical protein